MKCIGGHLMCSHPESDIRDIGPRPIISSLSDIGKLARVPVSAVIAAPLALLVLQIINLHVSALNVHKQLLQHKNLVLQLIILPIAVANLMPIILSLTFQQIDLFDQLTNPIFCTFRLFFLAQNSKLAVPCAN